MANEMKLLARIKFVADKMVQNIKKCISKNDFSFVKNPVIEPETGLMIATDGQILTVMKLKEYHCELADEECPVGGVHIPPVEVTRMAGKVTVEILSDGYDEVVRATDERGTTADLKQEGRYPNWRSVIPRETGSPVTVDWKAWDAVLREMQKVIKSPTKPNYPIQVYGERDSRTIRLSHYNVDTDEEWKRDVEVGWMPCKMFASFNMKRLRNILAFQPTQMHFIESTRAVMFTSDDTLMLLMPLYSSGDFDMACKVDQKDLERFDLAKWMMAKPQAAAKSKQARKAEKPKTKREPTLEERLREALLRKFKMAA